MPYNKITTHKSIQAKEETVDRKVPGPIKDAQFPRTPKTDKFYNGVKYVY